MEKRGVIDGQTPTESCTKTTCCGGETAPVTKEAADELEDGVTTRAAEVVADEAKKNADV